MATKIKYNHWDGGSGFSDKVTTIAYVKESPIEVLRFLMNKHSVYKYMGIYRPIDDSYPNNADGYILEYCNEAELKNKIKGLKSMINGSIDDLKFEKGLLNKNRNIEDVVLYIKKTINKKYNRMLEIINDGSNLNYKHYQTEIDILAEILKFI